MCYVIIQNIVPLNVSVNIYKTLEKPRVMLSLSSRIYYMSSLKGGVTSVLLTAVYHQCPQLCLTHGRYLRNICWLNK